MSVRFLITLPIAFTFLVVPQFSPSISSSRLCSSLAADVQGLGEQGKNGITGKKGQDGRNSDSLTVFADGSPMTLDLSGENGFPGEDGVSGDTALCEEQAENLDKNLQGSNGGDGGDGGDGGKGGNGGSLTIYTTDKSYLQQIYAIAVGGEGGAPGKGATGGEGCKCSVAHWSQQTCKGKPGSSDYSCTTREFNCTDGLNGRAGRDGRVGAAGGLGNLTLINLDKSLAPDQPEATITIGQLKDRGFTLSRNEWETRTGAASLLAPGSIIADEYKELIARHEHTVLLVWDAPQQVSDFADQRVILSLKGDNDATVTFPQEMWLDTEEAKRDRITEFFVFNALLEKDVTRLKSQGLSGTGSNLQLTLLDEADKSNIVKTDFSIKYRVTKSADESRFRRVFDYKTRYEGVIPPEAVNLQGDRFTIKLGDLPIPPEYLERGTAIEVQLTANRSFGDRSKEQKITVRSIIEK